VSTATIARRCAPAAAERTLFEDTMEKGEPTLEELIAGAWEGLAVHGTVRCPVCGAAMHARHGAGRRSVEGRCVRCGARLS
jgi:tRNA(Ile2) C34 agmatinyltransferase TiaS